MRALVYTAPFTVEMRDVPDPVPEAGQALVAVGAVGICGSDMHGFAGHDERRIPPLILGHEAAGTALSGKYEGKRVTINPLVSCGECSYCIEGRDNICPDRKLISIPPREGAFAEKLAIAERNLVVVPDGVAIEQAALAEPIACGWHAMRMAAKSFVRPLADARVVILGGGAIGLGTALVARLHGVSDIWVSDPSPARRATVQAAGPFKTFDGKSGGPEAESAELVVDAYGSEASRASSTDFAAPGGVIAHIGLAGGGAGLDTRRMTLQEITFFGTYTYTMADFRATARSIFDGRLGDFNWVEQRPLSDGAAAFADLKEGNVGAAKIVLRP